MNALTLAASLILSAVAAASAAESSAVAAPLPHPADACAALGQFHDASVRITGATWVAPAPTWNSPAIYGRSATVDTPFCRVEGSIETRIGFEFWLPPAERWNGRLLGAGVGGDAGFYNYPDLARGVTAGYATISNDSGHKLSEAHWMMRREALDDYTHRSQHLMNVTARTLLAAYYGQGPHHAYFIGCSGGGRQALKEMQRYPLDYDGVIAGAAAPRMPVMSARHLWQALYQQRHPAGAMSDADWTIVARAAVAACDANDGVVDGVVENPASCRFDVRQLQCRTGQTQNCLSTAQVRTVRSFYAPLRDESGHQLDSGLVPGVRTRPGPPSPLLLPLFAEGAHQDLAWGSGQFHMRDDLALIDRTMPEMKADETELRAFAARGGRAILYQGWLDPSVVAGQSIDYVLDVRHTVGAAEAERIMRLYMVPGMLHCGGGDGVDQFGGANARLPVGSAHDDLLTALTQWVEQGVAPTHIKAVRVENGQVTRQRILCPYPQQAHFQGGDSNDVSRYQCGPPASRRN
jgi:feruloyl esterase